MILAPDAKLQTYLLTYRAETILVSPSIASAQVVIKLTSTLQVARGSFVVFV